MENIIGFKTIVTNYRAVDSDFTGISFNSIGVESFFISLLLSLFIIVVYYLFGQKIRKLCFPQNNNYHFFINIALGYALIGSGLAILGMASLLQVPIIAGYLLSIFLIALYPYHLRFNIFSAFLKVVKKYQFKRKNIIVLCVCLFVGISFLRLMTPEIGEDAYHTDLPHLYLTSHTSMHQTRDPLHVIPYPQLAEMTYMIPLFFGNKEATRFIHFYFYLLIIILLFTFSYKKTHSFAKFSPLLFVTAPVVIRYAASQYIDFFMVFTFILAILVIQKKSSRNGIILSGLILGAAFATKVWVLIYLPAVLVYVFYLNRTLPRKKLIILLLCFIASSLIIPALWYIRAYEITGNPLYPTFAKFEYLDKNTIVTPPSSYYFGLNLNMFSPANMSVLSPLFFISALLFLFQLKRISKSIKQVQFFFFFIILSIEQLVVKVDLGRYLLLWYTVSSVIVSAGISLSYDKKIIRYGFFGVTIALFMYYFINTLLVLPYGFGWADKNRYLTRVLIRDNASYYDFDHLFDKHLASNDIVATYGIYGYYYGNFTYLDVNYIFSKNQRDFTLLEKNKVTKLLIKGGDIQWFCQTLALKKCNTNDLQLLASYPQDTKKYNLYSFKK